MVPDFLCIGAQKAGTSWLDAMLRQHKGVFLPPMKEVHFFDFIHIPGHRKWVRVGFRKTARKLGRRAELAPYLARLAAIPRRRDEWYAAVFDLPEAAGRVRGEITPAYALLPAAGVEHVRATNPGMKVILILRDPVERALSQLRMAAGRRDWEGVDEARLDEAGILPAVLAHSRYRATVARWEAAFPPEQMLYLPYRRMGADPEGFMRRVESFLGVGAQRYRQLHERRNATRPAAVAPALVALLEERLADERAWLADRFGADFGAGATVA